MNEKYDFNMSKFNKKEHFGYQIQFKIAIKQILKFNILTEKKAKLGWIKLLRIVTSVNTILKSLNPITIVLNMSKSENIPYVILMYGNLMHCRKKGQTEEKIENSLDLLIIM